jgi:hypothetical protein
MARTRCDREMEVEPDIATLISRVLFFFFLFRVEEQAGGRKATGMPAEVALGVELKECSDSGASSRPGSQPLHR